MAEMRDDERYPIVVHSDPRSGADLPEVAPPSEADKFPVYDDSGAEGPYSADGKDDMAGGSKGRIRTWCGLQKKVFWLLVVIVVIVVVGAIVGGAVGGVLAHNSQKNTSGNSDDGSTITNRTLPLDKSERAVAASSSTSTGATGADMQVFYQDLDTTTIKYRLVWNDTAQKENDLTLDIEPRIGASIAATTTNSTSGDSVTVYLFYTTVSTDILAIAQATLECGRDGATCTVNTNKIISGAQDKALGDDTSLAATLLGDGTSLRVFHQVAGLRIWALIGDTRNVSSWAVQNLVGPAVSGSGIGASIANDTTITLEFVASVPQKLRYTQYDDSIGQTSVQTVDDTPGSGFTPTVQIATCYQPGNHVVHLYYVASSSREIIEYRLVNSTWDVGSKDVWGMSDGAMAAIAWDDQIRLLYMNDGNLAMSAHNGKRWLPMENL